MLTRIVTIRPPDATPDELDSLVTLARNLRHDARATVEQLSLAFSAPEAAWIEMRLTIGDRSLDWWLPSAPDPFALPWDSDRDELSVTFLYWLEAIAAGRSAALGFDMEGPVGLFLVSGNPASGSVAFTCIANRGEVEFAVTIDRHVLVRDIYTALIAYWESHALNAAWSQWSSKPKWSLRSAGVDRYLEGAKAIRS